MKNTLLISACAILATFTQNSQAATTSATVPGTSNIWLAGQPAGTTLAGDTVPGQSPVLVTGLPLAAGSTLTFTGVTGTVGYPGEPSAADGASPGSHGTAFGLSGITAYWNSLLGVFVDASVPSGVAPTSLNFGTSGGSPLGRDFTSLSPLLSQVFFIGNGLTSGSVVQGFVVPSGATRLFLGTLDGSGWYNNTGSFSMTITETSSGGTGVPDAGNPLSLAALAGIALALCVRWARRDGTDN
jgi:hypothetical protein